MSYITIKLLKATVSKIKQIRKREMERETRREGTKQLLFNVSKQIFDFNWGEIQEDMRNPRGTAYRLTLNKTSSIAERIRSGPKIVKGLGIDQMRWEECGVVVNELVLSVTGFSMTSLTWEETDRRIP